MFQKSLLKNFIKSFNIPHDHSIIKLVTKDKFIAEDANGAEFISLLANFLNWDYCVREVKEKIAKHNKHMDGLNVVEKIEIKEEIEKLEQLVQTSIETIDQMTYKLYGLSRDEIAIVKGRDEAYYP